MWDAHLGLDRMGGSAIKVCDLRKGLGPHLLHPTCGPGAVVEDGGAESETRDLCPCFPKPFWYHCSTYN